MGLHPFQKYGKLVYRAFCSRKGYKPKMAINEKQVKSKTNGGTAKAKRNTTAVGNSRRETIQLDRPPSYFNTEQGRLSFTFRDQLVRISLYKDAKKPLLMMGYFKPIQMEALLNSEPITSGG